MKRVFVKASTEYEVIISGGILKECGEMIKKITPAKKAALISDDKVYALYGDTALSSLKNAGFEVCVYTFKNGEKSKTAAEYIKILEFLAENTLTRGDIAVALGGGVVGDMTGFAAATYLRGISFVQLPTTLLAAVDSSVGGKTGVNLSCGKNLAGAFHQPSLVICDTDTFATLDGCTFADGVSEAVKCGMICDEALLRKMSGNVKDNKDNNFIKDNIEEIVENCVKIKRDVVCEDEFDTGKRQLLNFGHTVGHAIEKRSGFSVTHGHAVAMGMAAITRSAEKTGLCESGTTDKLVGILRACSLPTECEYGAEELINIMLSDKKRSGSNITLVLPKKAGRCVLHKIPVDELFGFIEKGLKK